MSDHTDSKGEQLLAAGAIDPDPQPAWAFKVRGEHGEYDVILGAHVQLCTCAARRFCSHLDACLKLVHAEQSDPEKHAEYLSAREGRLERDRGVAVELFQGTLP